MTDKRPKLYLNLYWHMHQPDYRDTLTGQYVLPWTYLHAIKDYTDMAWHLEANPQARVTFNFVPVLLDQLEDYSDQFATGDIRDPLLALLAEEALDNISTDQCNLIIDSCFKSHHEKMLAPFAHYQRLHNIYKALQIEGSAAFNYLSAQYKADLLVWYHLAWTGESIRRTNTFVQKLMEKGTQFTLDERRALFRLIGELISGLIPRYKALQDQGRIELSTTPHYHPIVPLLLDFKSTRDAMPYAPLPHSPRYPGGSDRACAHIRQAQASHATRFGKPATGMWPAEGAVSYATLTLMAQHGLKWAATGEGVLTHSLYKSFEGFGLAKQDYLYQPYRITDGHHDILCFFRDDGLSDKIGFEYSKLYASEAVSDFIRSLEQIQSANTRTQCPVVSVILDGENAWEYYPYNAYYFLSELYAALVDHPNIEMATFSDILAMPGNTVAMETLPEVAAGSWVYGSFSTWIGSAEKNRGWDLLCDAKECYDRAMQDGLLTQEEIVACERQLAICEGSDWFWWFGDYNSAMSVDSFDRLYRRNLSNLYHLLKLPVPEVLNHPISVGAGDPAVGGTMRRGQEA
ncbi:glycoside hydrolase family 57 protein [Methylovorus glucosotrophus]|uniref:Glycoside hydrolase family 57 n=1 Tax=Methylovorus glucosotrophus (strain SIP3-4) TaxID=582744 RepID=C6XD93_METGS|nr:glycoside hydrolase family 57 protein [Methylovorus glucosotrophus]ACT50518.1 glycoside hydrolase family 57 [Methylovorus glucosotrophus SIP3-4]KAF0844077.1 alpha-amylase/alpha-mannosidase (GH57 family) [Methylovorus glucosotrophus]